MIVVWLAHIWPGFVLLVVAHGVGEPTGLGPYGTLLIVTFHNSNNTWPGRKVDSCATGGPTPGRELLSSVSQIDSRPTSSFNVIAVESQDAYTISRRGRARSWTDWVEARAALRV
jgi:hypothetical protein